MRPNQTFHVLETLRKSSPVPLFRKGIGLSTDDTQTTLDVYQQWILLCVDLGYLTPETLERQAQRLWSDMTRVDVLVLNNSFAECLQIIRLKSTRGFKALCNQISTHLYHMIKDDYVLVLEGDVFAAKRLIQLFSYTGRLSLTDIDLTQQLLDEYVTVEENILHDFPDEIILPLNKIIKKWLGPYVPDVIKPKHGPGGIAECGRCSLQRKYELLRVDQKLRYAFTDAEAFTSDAPPLERISKTIFVPKSYKTFRTISMEPATLQYYQQGVWSAIDDIVFRNRYLRNRIGFHDQLRNRMLAREGSISRNYATIDLTSASDSVSYDLVKRLFRGTWLLRYIVCTRSEKTLLPDNRIIELKKFAPMGSSLCFPVETIVFASICEFVTRGHRVNGHYSVFGDDIIVPTSCVEDTQDILARLGFLVNYQKSFSDPECWFRESCGGEYCDGYDVTPMRVSRKYAHRDKNIRLEKLIEKANEAYSKGFRNLRYFYISELRKTGYVPWFSPSSLLSDNYTNYHTERRWNRNLQRIEVRASAVMSKYSKDSLSSQDEGIRYRHWLETTSNRISIGDGFESIICRPAVVVRNAWRGKSYEHSDQAFIDFSLRKGEFLAL